MVIFHVDFNVKASKLWSEAFCCSDCFADRMLFASDFSHGRVINWTLLSFWVIFYGKKKSVKNLGMAEKTGLLELLPGVTVETLTHFAFQG